MSMQICTVFLFKEHFYGMLLSSILLYYMGSDPDLANKFWPYLSRDPDLQYWYELYSVQYIMHVQYNCIYNKVGRFSNTKRLNDECSKSNNDVKGTFFILWGILTHFTITSCTISNYKKPALYKQFCGFQTGAVQSRAFTAEAGAEILDRLQAGLEIRSFAHRSFAHSLISLK